MARIKQDPDEIRTGAEPLRAGESPQSKTNRERGGPLSPESVSSGDATFDSEVRAAAASGSADGSGGPVPDSATSGATTQGTASSGEVSASGGAKYPETARLPKLVSKTDLGIPYTTPWNRALVRFAQSALGINRINALYGESAEAGFTGREFAEDVLRNLGIKIEVAPARLQNIPATGPFIVVANHPHGALDGLALAAVVAKIRPDVKFLGNFLLSKIDPLKELFIPVDPFDPRNKRNIPGVRRALEHLESGAPLIVFPAGEVSTYQKGFTKLQDKPWSSSMMKMALRAGVPLVPLFIDGSNSLKFRIFGKAHPIFRTIRLPLELLGKRDSTVALSIGSPLSPKRQHEIGSVQKLSDFLRANVYCLRATLGELEDPFFEGVEDAASRPAATSLQQQNLKAREVIPAADRGLITAELEAIKPRRMITEMGGLQLFFAPSGEIPVVMHEIARLREITFRAIGEGTLLEQDSDAYDRYYDQLFIWDTENHALVGAYRVGFGDRLMDERSFEGFYTYSLFEFSRGMSDVLRQSLELGRSFITAEYQRRSQALLLLWRGILDVLLRNPGYRYLIGPVSMSGSYMSTSKWLLVNYIRAHAWNTELARAVVPRHGISALGRQRLDPDLLANIDSPELLDKLIRDIENTAAGVPVLIKKYLQLGGRVAGFNVDPLFNDSLDAMLVLDLREVPKAKIDMVGREFSDDIGAVYARFRAIGNVNV